MPHEPGDTEPGDALPSHALAVLTALLAQDRPGFAALRAQVPYARVAGGCGCGCASLSLAVVDPANAPAAEVVGSPVAEGDVLAPDGRCGGVLLFVAGGMLSYLEIHSYEEEPFAAWPPVEHVTVSRAAPAA
ncbi:hypothetical protein [Streptomyces sp. A5-4]|uniref:hypothetical protein n=1 Tax=Streptomyces sp. A5-4 TaxID=3384771 RepID=UPI003DA890E7